MKTIFCILCLLTSTSFAWGEECRVRVTGEFSNNSGIKPDFSIKSEVVKYLQSVKEYSFVAHNESRFDYELKISQIVHVLKLNNELEGDSSTKGSSFLKYDVIPEILLADRNGKPIQFSGKPLWKNEAYSGRAESKDDLNAKLSMILNSLCDFFMNEISHYPDCETLKSLKI
ncbi:MAG: hypothetical protein R2877_04295 [Bdellovibrionota bacterium]